MKQYRRYAVYFTPWQGSLAEFGAAWLGWSIDRGIAVPHPDIPGLPADPAELTSAPRKYGFHATIKPPFALRTGRSVGSLDLSFRTLCTLLRPVRLDGLRIGAIGQFLALVPDGSSDAVDSLAARVVATLDPFRAPDSEDTLQRRRAAGLTRRQDALLLQWGYPFVMEEFRFHMTLTGILKPGQRAATLAALAPVLAPVLPRPFVLDALTLVGETEAGAFETIHRVPLSG